MSAAVLLDRLQGVSKHGEDRWRARCPACGGDNAQKLAIRELSDGRVLLKCFGGCGSADVVAAVGLKFADLFPAGNRVPNDPARTARANHWHAAHLAIEILRRECLICALAADSAAAGRALQPADLIRVAEAAGRIRASLEAVR